MKYLVIAVMLFLAGLAVTRLNVEEQNFLPVVRLRTDGGAFVTIVHSRRTSRKPCQKTVDLLVDSLRACVNCAIESQGCTTSLTGLDKALADGELLPVYSVSARDVRVSIVGPPSHVLSDCEALASQIASGGIPSKCIHPTMSVPPLIDKGSPRS